MLKKTKERITKNSGITLIALVVTLVILLILAGVSIDFVLGENGIVGKAVLAREKQQIADYKEAIDLILIDAHMQSYMGETNIMQYAALKMSQNSIFEGAENVSSNGLVAIKTKEGYYFHITENEAIYAGKTQQEVFEYVMAYLGNQEVGGGEEEEYTYAYAGNGMHDVYDSDLEPVTEEECTFEDGVCTKCGVQFTINHDGTHYWEDNYGNSGTENCVILEEYDGGDWYNAGCKICGCGYWCKPNYDGTHDILTENPDMEDSNPSVISSNILCDADEEDECCSFCGWCYGDTGEETDPEDPDEPEEELDCYNGGEHSYGYDGYCIYGCGSYDENQDQTLIDQPEP